MTANEMFNWSYLHIVQFLFTPFKYLGLFGTFNHPRYFKEGDKVPQWLQATSQFNLDFTFMVDCEVYYQYKTDWLVVRPIHLKDENKPLLKLFSNVRDLYMNGAPTCIMCKCRDIPNNKLNLIPD